MKTSYILLMVIAFVTGTGMVATDVLLRQQYNRIDWRNPYQHFDTRPLPTARHWVIEGTPSAEIVALESTDKPQALIAPGFADYYHIRQQGDTVFVNFIHDNKGYQVAPRSDADHELGVRLVLRLPALQTLRIQNGRVTLSELNKDSLRVTLQKQSAPNRRRGFDRLFCSGRAKQFCHFWDGPVQVTTGYGAGFERYLAERHPGRDSFCEGFAQGRSAVDRAGVEVGEVTPTR